MTGPVSTSLEALLKSKSDIVDYFYNDTLAPHAKARPGLTPVPMEYSNWIEEQRAWRNTAVLFDQSHHMPELFVRGPDSARLLSKLGFVNFEKAAPMRGKQFLACNDKGQVIGECLVYCHAKDDFELVSGMPAINWVEYHAKTGGYDVTLVRDNHTAGNPTGTRIKFRFGMDGPNAAKIFAEAVEGEAPQISFFGMAKIRIAGCDVTALRHGMAGHQGVELSGRFEDGAKVRARLLEVGAKHGIKPGGNSAYFSSVAESGWIAAPVPAILTHENLRAYREYLPATTWEANVQLGGSYISKNLEDYYCTPWDLGIGERIKFEHDFTGREALEKMSKNPTSTRRTLIWNNDDVAKIHNSLTDEEGLPCKMIRLPTAAYGYQQFDAVRTADGALAGRSTFVGYTANERKYVSLGMMDIKHAAIGTELVLTWGEPNGGSRKAHVERHRQTEVRVTVASAPFADTVKRIKYGVIS